MIAMTKTAVRVRREAQPFHLSDVRLGEGPFKLAMEIDGQDLLRLDTDRLALDFRLVAGVFGCRMVGKEHGR
jgi:hypothetical protein